MTTEVASAFTPLSPRIQRFRDASRARGAAPPESARAEHFVHAFFDVHEDLPHWERYARSLAHSLEQETVFQFDDEQLVGMLYQCGVNSPRQSPHRERWAPYCHVEHARRRNAGGSPGHIGWRWDVILELGIEGLMARLRGLLEKAVDEKARQLYEGSLILWQAALKWADRHVETLEAGAAQASGHDRERLDRLVAICSRVPRKPARTFREALQSFYLQFLIVMFENPYGGNGPGRVDYFLWPCLQRDLASQAITEAEAKELVDELLIRMHERVQPADGWVEAVMAGGTAPDGSSSLNPLSYMLVESIGALDQTHPSVYTRVRPDDPDDFIDLNVRYLLHGHNRAQIYNEEAMLRAITKSGAPPEDAAMYMAGGCMEISVQGMAGDMNFTRTYNVAKTLELTLTGGVDLLDSRQRLTDKRALPDYRDFEGLYTAFEGVLARDFREMVRSLDIAAESFAEWRPCYLLSSLVNDCLARGREQLDGGARYHDYGVSFLGLTSAADSLNAIRKAVYEERAIDADELLQGLRDNYEGHEEMRLQLGAVPRYGVQDSDADAMADRVLQSVCRLAVEPTNRWGGRLKPMFFNFTWTPGASKALGARADGLRAGERIGHGLTPQQMAMKQGITAAMNSSLSLDLDGVAGGATTMWDVDEQWITFDVMKALLKRFLAGGGMIFQGNTTSVKELEEALEKPDRHPNLIVRVGGFSARFVTLDPDLQQEIITRYRHSG